MKSRKLLAAGAVGLLVTLGLGGQAFAYTTASGFAASDFATGFSTGTIGPVGLAFDASNHLFVMEYPEGILYKFGMSGGAASASTRVNTLAISGSPAGIAFSKDGRLYVARQASGDVVEISATTGVVLRVVATDLPGATGIATDPLSGDLFVTGPFTSVLWRLASFSTGTATRSTYQEVFDPDGITFGPDGTIYLASGGKAVTCAAVKCAASFRFDGAPGWYTLGVEYFDQNNGASQFRLSVAHQVVDAWTAAGHLPTGKIDATSSTRHVIA